jgi:hypothetical protein
MITPAAPMTFVTRNTRRGTGCGSDAGMMRPKRESTAKEEEAEEM